MEPKYEVVEVVHMLVDWVMEPYWDTGLNTVAGGYSLERAATELNRLVEVDPKGEYLIRRR